MTSNIEIHLKLLGENADGVKSHPELKMTNEKQVECLEKYGLEGKSIYSFILKYFLLIKIQIYKVHVCAPNPIGQVTN